VSPESERLLERGRAEFNDSYAIHRKQVLVRRLSGRDDRASIYRSAEI
jgi:hypothetical protein